MSILDTAALIISITAVFAYINHRFIKLPTTIGVMSISLFLSVAMLCLSNIDDFQYTKELLLIVSAVDFNQVVLDCMLSSLLFAGALHVNINDIKDRKWAIGLMASIGVLITTFLIGVSSYYVFTLLGFAVPFIYCLLFGALISPTDPIAVLGILKTVGAPKSLETKVVGESLFNDGIALVIFLVILGIATNPMDVSAGSVLLLFAEEAIGGLLFGAILGYIGYKLIKSVDNYHVEVLLTLAMVLGGYSLAQNLHVSGPLAVVVAGLMIGNKGRALAMSDETRKNLDTFWELIDEILNAVLFVLIGVELLVISFTGSIFIAGVVLIPVILLARLLSTGALVGVLRKKMEFSKGAVWILTWGGLRGAISVALALSIPEGEYREIIIATTYIVVVFSILVQGLTIGKLIKKFNKNPEV